MKMKIKHKLSFLLVFILAIACNEDILDKTDPNKFTSKSYYIDGDQLTLATNAIYSQFLGADLFGRMMQYFSDCRADEHAAGGTQLEPHNAQLLDGSYDNANYPIQAAWRGLYRVIHRSNAVIQNGPEIENIEPALLNQRVAEARFLRAWAYFNLTVHWGEIPIYTEVAESTEDVKPVSTEAQIYTFLESELTDIQSTLDWTYTGDDAGRASQGAVKLLLARVYMQQGKFAEARTVLLDIHNNGPFMLVDNYADNFMEETEYNNESIFEIGFAGTGFTWAGDANSTNARSHVMFQDYSPVAWRNCIPSNALLASFERPSNGDAKEDPRLTETVYFTGDIFGDPADPDTLKDSDQNGYSSIFDGSTVKCSWKKYSPMYKLNPGGYYTSNINYRNMRYAEVLVKLAECENELENSAAARGRAMGYLNDIRNRVSVAMPGYPTTNYPCDSYDEMMRAIMHESMVEFSNEKLRVVELARWRKLGKFSTLNPDPIAYIATNPAKALLPYPLEEVTANPNIN